MTMHTAPPRLIVAPERLHHADGWTLWHSGLVAGPHGLHTTVEILDATGRDRITGPAWEIPAMGTSPLDVAFTQGASSTQGGSSHPGVVTQASTPRSYTVGVYLKHPAPATDSLTVHVVARPLNASVRLTAG